MILAGLVGLSLMGWVPAALADDPVGAGPEALTHGLLQEKDVALLFRYLREALGAAVDGREAPVPEELVRRAEAIREEVKRRGATVGRAILDAIEVTVRENLREPPQLPPTSPLQRI